MGEFRMADNCQEKVLVPRSGWGMILILLAGFSLAIIGFIAAISFKVVVMVQMALDRLSKDKIVELDDERRAAMVSNLLVVLCSDRHAQPVINTGSLYS